MRTWYSTSQFPEHFPPIADDPLGASSQCDFTPSSRHPCLSEDCSWPAFMEKEVPGDVCMPEKKLLPLITDEYKGINTPAPLPAKCDTSEMPSTVSPEHCCQISPKWDFEMTHHYLTSVHPLS